MRKFLFFVLAITFFSCNSNAVFEVYKPVEKTQWQPDSTFTFIYNNTDTISKNNVFINLRNNNEYEFSSIFLIAKIKFPKGKTIIDTLEYEMTDEYGNWLGSGFTDIKENKLFYKENVIFTEQGPYQFLLENATRSASDIKGVNPLKGITDIGIRIENIQQ